MSYATPASLARRFGWDELCDLSDRSDEQLVTPSLLADVAAGSDVSEFTQAEQSAAVAALATVEQAITDASSEIDSYLASAVPLPLDDVPAVVETHAAHIARYYLFSDRVTEVVRVRYDDAHRLSEPRRQRHGHARADGSGRGRLLVGRRSTAQWPGSARPTFTGLLSMFDASTAAAQTAFTEHLDGIQSVTAELYPDDPSTFRLPQAGRGALLVRYDGRSYSDPASDLPRHLREIRLEVAVVTKNLRRQGGEAGAEELVQEVAEMTEGFQSDGFTFHALRDDFVDVSDGQWMYVVEVAGRRTIRLEV